MNRAGRFNVPLGSRTKLLIADKEHMGRCSAALANTVIRAQSFEQAEIRPRHFYYLEPPYHRRYSGYYSVGFDEADHARLASFCREIDREGGYFMLSNSDTPLVRKLYRGFHIETVQARRSVSGKAYGRKKEPELIIRNYTQ